MRFVALISGGKDSIYNLAKCVEDGHQLVAVLNLQTPGETDSYMYQYAGNELVRGIAQCLGARLFQRPASGVAANVELAYSETRADEVEDLYQALKELQDECSFEGVAAGAIKSTYQKNRVENVCQRLNLVPLCYLWGRDQKELLHEMISYGMSAVVVKSGSPVIDQLVGCPLPTVYKEYGRYIETEVANSRQRLSEEEFNICGEGGEYETITLDCPLFTSRIELRGAYPQTSPSGTVSLVIPQYSVLPK